MIIMSLKQSARLIPLFLLLSGCFPSGLQSQYRLDLLPSFSTFESNSEWRLEYELLLLTNQQRAQEGLPPLVLDDSLVRMAREHSQGMAQQGFISHNLPSGGLRVRMTRTGYQYQTARENVASSGSVPYAQRLLMNSSPHKVNILAADVDRVGIGIVRCASPSEKQFYITEIFAKPRDENKPARFYDNLPNGVNSLRQDETRMTLNRIPQRLPSDPATAHQIPTLL
jgi:hypothetical protein